MLNEDVPFPPRFLFGMYTDELEIYLDKINEDSSCLFNTMIAILLYNDDDDDDDNFLFFFHLDHLAQ